MKRLLLATALLLVAAGCASADSGPSATASETTAEVASPTAIGETTSDEAASSGDFCALGNAFVTDTNVRLVTTPSADTFTTIDTNLAALADQAPQELQDSVATLQTGFEAIGESYAATGFDPAATLELAPEIQDANTIAVTELQRFLRTNCDLAGEQDAQISQIRNAFSVDEATAECLHAQLGNIANIDASSLTPELMITPVCDTTILGLLSGDGG